MTLLDVQHLQKKYQTRFGAAEVTALKDISFSVEEGEYVAVMGESGSGKTTLLNILATLDRPTAGSVFLNGENIQNISAKVLTEFRRDHLGFVFQDFNLLETLSVYDNMVLPLVLARRPISEMKQKVEPIAQMLGIKDLLKKYPYELSGGQQQRVAIARALVNEPEVLLLDEPLSALDLKLRTDMQYELRELQQRLGITFIFVTHDQEEALAMSDEIFVMSKGEIIQSGTPVDIYDEPINRFVADFIGESNIVDGVMKEDYLVEFVGKEFECADAGMRPNEKVEIVIRPEDLALTSIEKGKLTVEVDTQLFRGVHYEIICYDENGNEWMIHSTRKAEVGSKVGLYFEPQDIHVMRFGESEEDFDARLESYEDEVEEND